MASPYLDGHPDAFVCIFPDTRFLAGIRLEVRRLQLGDAVVSYVELRPPDPRVLALEG